MMSPNRRNGGDKKQLLNEKRVVQSIDQLFAEDTIETMMERDFYVIEFNIGCRPRDDVYIPVEVGVVKFSIKDGIKGSFHDLIDPGRLPFGYGLAAKDATETHGIPFDSIYHKNYNKLCEHMYTAKTSRTDEDNYLSSLNEAIKKLDEFIQPEKVIRQAEGGNPREYIRPIFTSSGGVVQTDRCLKRLAEQTQNLSFYEGFAVLDIAHMTKFACKFWPKADKPIAVFTQAYGFHLTICISEEFSCKFHYDIGNLRCALRHAFISAYCYLDLVCPHYPVVITEKHLEPVSKPSETESETIWTPSTYGYRIG